MLHLADFLFFSVMGLWLDRETLIALLHFAQIGHGKFGKSYQLMSVNVYNIINNDTICRDMRQKKGRISYEKEAAPQRVFQAGNQLCSSFCHAAERRARDSPCPRSRDG